MHCFFKKGEVALGTGALKTGGQYGTAAVHGAHQQYKDVEILALETDRRQNDIEIHGGEHQCDGDVQQRAAQGRAHGFAFLFRAGLAAEALKVGVVPICILHRRFLSLLICLLVLL